MQLKVMVAQAGLFLLAAVGSLPAATISYTATWARGPHTSYRPGVMLPVFNTASVDIPDDAVLTDTSFRIQSSFTSFNHTFNESGSPIQIEGTALISAGFGADAFSLSQPFSVALPSGSSSMRHFNLASDFELSTIPPVIPGYSGEFYFIEGLANYGFMGIPQGPGITSVNEFMFGSVTASVTYSYETPTSALNEVPEGGATLVLMGLSLLGLLMLHSNAPHARLLKGEKG